MAHSHLLKIYIEDDVGEIHTTDTLREALGYCVADYSMQGWEAEEIFEALRTGDVVILAEHEKILSQNGYIIHYP